MINNYPQPAAPVPGQPYYPPPPGYAPQPGYAPPPAYGYPPAPPPAAPQQSQVFQPSNTINIVNSAAPVVEKKPKKKVIKTNTYPSTVGSKQRSPTWITCPYCRKNGLTKCEFVAGDGELCAHSALMIRNMKNFHTVYVKCTSKFFNTKFKAELRYGRGWLE